MVVGLVLLPVIAAAKRSTRSRIDKRYRSDNRPYADEEFGRAEEAVEIQPLAVTPEREGGAVPLPSAAEHSVAPAEKKVPRSVFDVRAAVVAEAVLNAKHNANYNE